MNNYRTEYQKRVAQRDLLTTQIELLQSEISRLREEGDIYVQARWVFAEVAKATQQNFKNRIESLVSMAMESVYQRPFRFLVDFDIVRNKSECLLRVQEGDDSEPFLPKDEMGGGLLDVISFALRVVLWSLQKPLTRPFLWLDEPMKFTGRFVTRAGEMIRQVSKELGIQIIITTHEDDLISIADKSWVVSHNGTHSDVVLRTGTDSVEPHQKPKKIRRRNE